MVQTVCLTIDIAQLQYTVIDVPIVQIVLASSEIFTFFYVKWWITDPEVVSRFVVQRQVPDCPDIPVVAQRQFLVVQLKMQFRTRLLLCPLLVNDRSRSSAVAVLPRSSTPLSLRSG